MGIGGTVAAAGEDKLQILVEASAILLGTLDIDELLSQVLDLGIKLNEAQACALWLNDKAAGTWQLRAYSGLSARVANLVLPSLGLRFPGDRPICFEDVHCAPALASRLDFYRSEGIRSSIVMPMYRANSLYATLIFYYRSPRRFSDVELRVATGIRSLASAAIDSSELYREKERARRAAEQAQMRATLLAEASAVLASSREYECTLAEVARRAVPRVADCCAVHLLQVNGGLKLVEAASADPAQAARALAGAAFDPNVESLAARAIRNRRPELLASGANQTGFAWLDDLNCKSFLCAPMIARDHVLGLFTFASRSHIYDAGDLALAEDLAGRAAVSVDNAQLQALSERERAALEAALAALRDNEDRLLLALRSGRMGIWDWDIRANELTWTDELIAMVGFTPISFDGAIEGFLALLHSEDRPVLQGAIEHALKTRSSFQCEFRVNCADGGVRWLGAQGQAFCREDGAPVRMTGVAMDITERRQLEDKLRTSQKLESIGLLAGGIAHDFNNLLTGIMGNAGLARDSLSSSHQVSPLLDNVLQAAERAADLTRQLLAYSGKGRFIIEPINLSTLVSEIVKLVRATIPKLVRLELELDPELPAIEGDASQIQQIVMNLVINGAEAIGGHEGTVRVRTLVADQETVSREPDLEADGDRTYVLLEVQDDGCGMDASTRARIFDPFYTTKFTGRGLGLAAVSGIVRGHRGAISVESAPARGSIFRVLFPACGAAEVPPPKEHPRNLRGNGVVLVIDDEESVRAAAAAGLRRYGYDVMIATNGAEGVEMVRRRPAGLVAVLLDLTMPVLEGDVALQRIKAIQPDLPVIASSGYTELEATRRFPTQDLAGFLQKPYTALALARKIKTVLSKPRVRGHRG